MGALTNKVSAFKFRPWELKVLKLSDVSNIERVQLRIEYKDFDVLRVLPASKNNWLMNYTRDFYTKNYSELNYNNNITFYYLIFNHNNI